VAEDEKCPYCGSKERQVRYNKWHVREVYCTSCWRCLNRESVRRRTWLAEMASKEGRINEFYIGTYEPSVPMPDFSDVEEEEEEGVSIEEEIE
jgi:hypothetical protein